MDLGPKVNSKTLKTSRKKIGIDCEFLDTSPKAQTTKEKIIN